MVIDSFKGSNEFLSNFYTCIVWYNGRPFVSSEHAYVAAKKGDEGFENWVSKKGATLTAGKIKKLGRTIELRPRWNDIRIGIMEEILWSKFQDIDLALMLIKTGDAELIEGNWWGDTFWGVCRGEGENNLGKLLMKIRELRRRDIENALGIARESIQGNGVGEPNQPLRTLEPFLLDSQGGSV